MGIVGMYIDALSDEQRDRIIEAKDFYDGDEDYFDPEDSVCGCLVGVAEMVNEDGDCPIDDEIFLRLNHRLINPWPSQQFPSLCDRFGKDRIVALCKARAAKGNRLPQLRSKVYEGQREAGLVPMGGMNGRPEDLR